MKSLIINLRPMLVSNAKMNGVPAQQSPAKEPTIPPR